MFYKDIFKLENRRKLINVLFIMSVLIHKTHLTNIIYLKIQNNKDILYTDFK